MYIAKKNFSHNGTRCKTGEDYKGGDIELLLEKGLIEKCGFQEGGIVEGSPARDTVAIALAPTTVNSDLTAKELKKVLDGLKIKYLKKDNKSDLIKRLEQDR